MAHDDESELTAATVALLSAIRQNELPQCLEATIVGNVPKSLQFICEPVAPDESWALEDDFVPVWTNNHTSCLAYVPSLGNYRYQHIEDYVDGETSCAFETFEHVTVLVLAQLIGGSEEELKSAARFFGFDAVDELLDCKSDLEFLSKHNLEHLG